MRYVNLALLLVLCSSHVVAAESADQYVDLSYSYSQGDFDTGQKTKLSQMQVTYGQVRDAYDFSIAIPYLFLSDSFGNESGLGDITLQAGMSLSGTSGSADTVYASVSVKLPTADETKGLGTGETDYGGFLNYTHDFASLSLSIMGGYIVTGDSKSQSYKDIMVYGLGVSKMVAPWYVYASLDGRQQTLATGDDPLELSAGLFYQLKQAQFIKVEGFIGLSNSSPDSGIMLGIINWF